ncbi:hypothetical protein BJV77DRAFT_1009835 [Russula vinacea]|nr:hypothetical protein BJV77DRAFT_1009835 [Russula vinacea]
MSPHRQLAMLSIPPGPSQALSTPLPQASLLLPQVLSTFWYPRHSTCAKSIPPAAFGPPQFPPFQPRSRRQPSLSTGGPPKAQLGGAGKNYRPPCSESEVEEGFVNIPKESVPGVDGEPSTRTSFARTPIPLHLVPPQPPTLSPDVIEEKLEKLGVEKGSGGHSTIPHIHAPHARAASISSPADPALLYFKLNKLQQAQNSHSHSASVSPQPSLLSSNNPMSPSPILQPPPPAAASSAPLRHGHSLSLAAAPFVPSRPYMAFNANMPYNPFGSNPLLPSDSIRSPDTRSDPGAPTDQSLAPPPMPVRADSRPDFVRGFGLDVPDETEEELEQEEGQTEEDDQSVLDGYEEERVLAEASHIALAGTDDTMDMELDVDEADAEVGSITTAAQSRVHSRHVSRLSATLSLLSVGSHVSDTELRAARNVLGEREGDVEDVGEWTGSEDLRTTAETTEDEESIGEWSNPSDEERARQARHHRRLMRHLIQTPRRIPNFPHPPVDSLPLTSLLSNSHRNTEEDMISNPSDDGVDHFPVLSFPNSSRPPSSRLPLHDPAISHSRTSSNNLISTPFQIPMPIPIQAPVPKRTEPFVFASADRRSGSFSQLTRGPQMQFQPQHQQQPYIPPPPPPLNAGAAEFKPNTFTFTPPPNMPKFPLPQPPTTLPALPSPPPLTNVDGREKRQRRGSVTSDDGRGSPSHKSVPSSPPERQETPSPAARPLVLPDLGGINIGATKEPALYVETPVSEGLDDEADEEGDGDADGEGEESIDEEHELPIPLSMKARRAPIPLDFKHPVSTNTVPAGLFKALANGSGNNGSGSVNNTSPSVEIQERAHQIVRSRLNSRENFEHVSRPSLDDLYVPAISQNVSRGRLITDPVRWDPPALLQEPPQSARDRRASLPAMASARSSFSDTSAQPPNISPRLELQHYEERLEALLESKLDAFRKEVRTLRLEANANSGASSASTEAAINEVVSLFRTQLQESAARGLDDSQVDARGELDFQLVKDIVEQGHAEARAVIQQDLDRILRRVEALQSAEVTPITGNNPEAMLEEYHARTRNTVVGAVAPITARLEALERTRTRTPLPLPQAATVDHEALVHELRAVLVPHILAMRAEPVDYELLTEQLSQAVKPHISQLIDLASDKRETAGLIVDRLIPVLPQIYPPAGNPIDLPAIVAQVTAEVRRIVAPLDAHEIKEQVSDLVVERLDSRMAVRDRALEGLSSKLVDGLDNILEPVNDVAARVLEVSKGQEALSVQTRDLASFNNEAMTLLSSLPGQISSATEPLRTILTDAVSTGSSFDKEGLALQDKTAELLALHQTVLSRLTDLPDSMAAVIKTAQVAQSELLARTVTRENDFENVVKEHLSVVESERDLLRAKVDEIQAVMLLRATDAATAQARATELEEALSRSLARLKTSDVTIESQQERLLELEKLNRELTSEKHGLIAKVHSLETQAGFASRDKEVAHDALLTQQTHWEDLRRTTEQLEHLSALLKELRRARDRSKVLEGEHAALQRRFKEQEIRATSSERATSTVRASLAQAQQRAAEWEDRANEHECALAEAEGAREAAEDRVAQLEEEHVLMKVQLEEIDAEERLAKDRENKLRDQVAALEARVAQLQVQVNYQSAAPRASTKTAASIRTLTSATAVSSPPRSDSRASTIYPSRSATPTAPVGDMRSRTNTPPTSVWDSMHAPGVSVSPGPGGWNQKQQGPAPVPRKRFAVQQDWGRPSRVASPTPSVVSVVPTLSENGWYE